MTLVYDLALSISPIRRLHEARNQLLAERDELARQLAARDAGLSLLRSKLESPFINYNTCFDAEEVVRRHAVAGLQPHAKYLTNYLGVLIDPKFFPQLLDFRAGEVEAPPIPGNWHADLSEFAACLRAVDLAGPHFTMLELGCGWGCWMNNTGVAARRQGKAVRVIGAEADEGHIGFAREACAANGFAGAEVFLHRGIVAASSGVALFPRQDIAGASWGLEPIFGATEAQLQQAERSGRFDILPMLALAELAAPFPRIDLLHIDIQGGEADFVESCLPVLQEKVAYLFIGAHSRQIEGRLFHTLLNAGWRLEIERPGILKLDGANPYMWIDGAQGWRNMALLPTDAP